ncbi:MAG TPA: WecB/TagA/CpsF family glycosyltransferase [Terriglobales bacterium]|nr:WecB/TagA/CpsF family glycosyltransferase [Terriglobales bacterium]
MNTCVAERSDLRETFDVLGVGVDAVQMEGAIARIERWIAERSRARMVTLTNVHAVMQAHEDEEFREVLNSADMVCPDGMPLIWVAKSRGLAMKRRVCGPELMLEFCRRTHEKGYSHYFYGGAEGVAELLAKRLKERFAGMRIAGWFSPPFRPLTREEDAEVVARINESRADVLWVGLGCPKQERWMKEHRESLQVGVMLGVGQAFDIHAGTLKQAPKWMRESGLEWMFRLGSEPRRLWKRYLRTNSKFLISLVLSQSRAGS